MNGIMAFFSAALPWIVMGVALAIFFARETKRKERRKDRQEKTDQQEKANQQEKEDDFGAEGMALGMCFGVAIATAMHWNIGLGLSLGMLLGLTIGSEMEKKDDDDEGSAP